MIRKGTKIVLENTVIEVQECSGKEVTLHNGNKVRITKTPEKNYDNFIIKFSDDSILHLHGDTYVKLKRDLYVPVRDIPGILPNQLKYERTDLIEGDQDYEVDDFCITSAGRTKRNQELYNYEFVDPNVTSENSTDDTSIKLCLLSGITITISNQ